MAEREAFNADFKVTDEIFATSCLMLQNSLFVILNKRHFGSTMKLEGTKKNIHTHQNGRTSLATLKTLLMSVCFGGDFSNSLTKRENARGKL